MNEKTHKTTSGSRDTAGNTDATVANDTKYVDDNEDASKTKGDHDDDAFLRGNTNSVGNGNKGHHAHDDNKHDDKNANQELKNTSGESDNHEDTEINDNNDNANVAVVGIRKMMLRMMKRDIVIVVERMDGKGTER